jgi:hypothetical protein
VFERFIALKRDHLSGAVEALDGLIRRLTACRSVADQSGE